MKHTRIPWAAAALLLPLVGCGTSEGNAAPSQPTPPPAPVAKSERTPVPPAKLESAPAPTPEPRPAVDPPPKPIPDPQPEPAPEPAPASKPADVSVTGFDTGGALDPEGNIGDPKTVFAAADTVHLGVLADGAARAVRIAVSWVGPDGVLIREDVQDPMLGEPKTVPFSLANAQGLALGLYKAEIRIEGWLASTAEFEVR